MTKNIIGENVLEQLCQECLTFGQNALIITQNNINPYLGLYARVLSLFNIYGLSHKTYQLESEMLIMNSFKEGINLAKENKVEMVIAIGDSNVVNFAKMIAVGYYLNDAFYDEININPIEIKSALPVINILTSMIVNDENNDRIIIESNIKEQQCVFKISSSVLLLKASFIDTFYVK